MGLGLLSLARLAGGAGATEPVPAPPWGDQKGTEPFGPCLRLSEQELLRVTLNHLQGQVKGTRQEEQGQNSIPAYQQGQRSCAQEGGACSPKLPCPGCRCSHRLCSSSTGRMLGKARTARTLECSREGDRRQLLADFWVLMTTARGGSCNESTAPGGGAAAPELS